MTKPLVSIQIPTYKQKHFIKDALDSALAQTYSNLQIIVADDCSTDYDIFEYLSSYMDNPKVLVHRNERNLGRVGNYRNTLFNLAKGDWFVNLDGDDFFTNENFIANAVRALNLTNKVVSAYQAGALTRKIREGLFKGEELELCKDTYVMHAHKYLENFNETLGFTHASILFNTQIAKNCNFYNRDTQDIDYFSYLKILKNSNIIFNGEKVYYWRQHNEQETGTLNFEKCVAKFSELDDLYLHYKDVPFRIKKKMLEATSYDLNVQLMVNFFDEKFTLKGYIVVIQRTKLKMKYWKPFLSLLKKRVFSKKNSKPV